MRRLLGLAVLALVLAGCGSSSDDDGGAGDAKAPVASADKPKVGRVIVDTDGRTLYRFTAEAQGRPVCTGACVKTWPPATTPPTTPTARASAVSGTRSRPSARVAAAAGPRKRTSAATATEAA